MNDTLSALKSNKQGEILRAIKHISDAQEVFNLHEVVPLLSRHLSSEDREIKLAAIKALGTLKAVNAVDALSMLLLNPPAKKSPLTGEIISEKNDVELSTALVIALQSINNVAAQTTIALWQRITPPEIVDIVRKQVAIALGDFDDDDMNNESYDSITATREFAIPIMPPAPPPAAEPESIIPPQPSQQAPPEAEEVLGFEDVARPSPEFGGLSEKKKKAESVEAKKRGDMDEGGEGQQRASEVQFSVYYPHEVTPQNWHQLTAYIHLPEVLNEVSRDVVEQYGVELATVRRIFSNSHQKIAEGTLITATPQLSGFQFNPPQIQIGFFEEWHRLEFKMRAKDAPPNLAQNGRMTFTVEGIIVAEVPLSVFVLSAGTQPTMRLNSLTQNIYQSIFCSYSRVDRKVVEKVERLYTALGFDFLRDVQTIKSGQDWDDQLYAMIERADIFQLFWSQAAAQSEWVGKEWRYALSLNREALSFIRPVYWQEPIPPVPQELGHIHFSYEPTLDD